jgi:hypothetical protein
MPGAARRFDPASQLSELLFGNCDLERTYVGGGLGGSTHDNIRAVRAGRGANPSLVGTLATLLLQMGRSNEWHLIDTRRSALVAPRAGL